MHNCAHVELHLSALSQQYGQTCPCASWLPETLWASVFWSSDTCRCPLHPLPERTGEKNQRDGKVTMAASAKSVSCCLKRSAYLHKFQCQFKRWTFKSHILPRGAGQEESKVNVNEMAFRIQKYITIVPVTTWVDSAKYISSNCERGCLTYLSFNCKK